MILWGRQGVDTGVYSKINEIFFYFNTPIFNSKELWIEKKS